MSEVFAETMEIMLAGMGGVFLFLILLTIAVTLLTQFCPEVAAPKSDTDTQANAPTAGEPESTSQSAKLAAVTVAVQKYRQARENASDQQE